MSTNLPGTITRYIRDLEGGQHPGRDDAVRVLWEHFFAEMMIYARKRLRAMHAPLGPADEEDAAAHAFMKVCRGIERGHLKLASRVDFTKVLRSATSREVLTILGRAKPASGWTDDDMVLGQVADSTLSPDLLLLAFDACQRLLELLETDDLRRIAIWKLVGHTNQTIAAKLGRSPATVERTLAQIRQTWRRKWSEAVPRSGARPGPRPGGRAAVLETISADHPGPEELSDVLRELAGLA
jgi:DNA-directed RNA polymerase specialized sigma24 family protein